MPLCYYMESGKNIYNDNMTDFSSGETIDFSKISPEDAEKYIDAQINQKSSGKKESYSGNRLLFITIAMVLLMAVVAIVSDVFVNSYSKKEVKVEVPEIKISSQNLNNGVWDTIITNTIYGQNFSPALSFDEVDGAKCYAIYMIDPDGGNWLHWRTIVNENALALGADRVNYVGPYPPSGTHTYTVYVFALKNNADISALPGVLDASGADIEKIKKGLEENCGIITSGTLSGTYTSGTK